MAAGEQLVFYEKGDWRTEKLRVNVQKPEEMMKVDYGRKLCGRICSPEGELAEATCPPSSIAPSSLCRTPRRVIGAEKIIISRKLFSRFYSVK
jgi:hypothetical protein